MDAARGSDAVNGTAVIAALAMVQAVTEVLVSAPSLRAGAAHRQAGRKRADGKDLNSAQAHATLPLISGGRNPTRHASLNMD